MAGIRAGRLQDKVSIQVPPAQDDYGQEAGAWSTSATRRCSIEPLNGKEYFARVGEVGEQMIKVRFRYESGLLSRAKRLADFRVSPVRYFDIEDVINPGNENRELIAMCVEREV